MRTPAGDGTRPPGPPGAPAPAAGPHLVLFAASLALHLLLLFGVLDFHHYFRKYPELGLRLLGETEPPIAVFHSSPLYVALVAAWARATGGAPWEWLKVAQAALGATSAVLTSSVGGRIFSRPTGLVAGLLVALHGPMLLLDLALLPDALLLFLGLALLHFALRFAETGRRRWLGLTGLALGLAVITRPSAWLVWPALVVWLWRGDGGATRLASALGHGGLVLAFAALPVLPVTTRNLLVGGDLVPVTATGGWVFYCSNNPRATGFTFAPPPEFLALQERAGSAPGALLFQEHLLSRAHARRETGRAMRPSEVSRHYLAKALAFVRDRPGDFLRLLARKARYAVNAFEPYDEPYLIADSLRLAGYPLSGLHLLLPLGLTGLAVWGRRGRPLLLTLFLVATLLPLLLTYVLARYRLPAVPALAILAARTLVEVAGGLRARRPRRPLLLLYAGVLPLSLLANVRDARIVREEEVHRPAFVAYTSGLWYLDSGQLDLAEAAFRSVLAIDPGHGAARERLRDVAAARVPLAPAAAVPTPRSPPPPAATGGR